MARPRAIMRRSGVPHADVHQGSYESAAAGGPVEYRVLTPPGWTGGERLPLMLVLHGANSSAATLEAQLPLYEQGWADGTLPPVLAACASTPTAGGFYIDQAEGGRWESLVAREFPGHLEREFGADLSRLLITGGSMGGYGALKIAFSQPDRFIAVAALEPAVFPGESAGQVRPRNTLGVLGELLAAMRDSPAGYASSHVVARLRGNADAIRRSDLAILVECGDEDCFSLMDGAEYLHRVLWDLDVSHEYHLVRGADHVGPRMADRQAGILLFVGDALKRAQQRAAGTGGAEVPAEFRAWLEAGAAGSPPPVDFSSAAGPAVLRLMTEAQRRDAAEQDPTVTRRYGVLPSL